jgi:hypothetical protein
MTVIEKESHGLRSFGKRSILSQEPTFEGGGFGKMSLIPEAQKERPRNHVSM